MGCLQLFEKRFSLRGGSSRSLLPGPISEHRVSERRACHFSREPATNKLYQKDGGMKTEKIPMVVRL
jgi:hypothetical protein